MNLKQDRIEEVLRNGYQLDFADVFNKAFENYKKIALYAGLMIFVFMVILMTIIASLGISILGVAALSQESMKELTLNMETLSGINLIFYMGASILFSSLLSPLQAGLIKMAYCAERDEEFHVSTVFSYYSTKYFIQIFIATFLILVLGNGISMGLNYSGIILIGPMVSLALSFFTILTIPLIIFSDSNAIDAIKYSFSIVSKQPLILLALIVVAVIGSMVGFIGCCVGVFFTLPFIYSMYYAIYSEIIGFDHEGELSINT
ncbi:hypothetical protein [Flavobacterium frigoris]|uniref:Beta-carotene 15,15'-monooxygenase n=1 Tax=Flavobacterium frigoris TaxID=229204 RepID=A0A1H9P5S9_FLAFI|nr:hypothetical protein [Flavobacterium frigoris]SER42923.1 hypothetical protein SAMN05444355_11253 [Flavobacterium frigoris]